jgi:hypothetical protein
LRVFAGMGNMVAAPERGRHVRTPLHGEFCEGILATGKQPMTLAGARERGMGVMRSGPDSRQLRGGEQPAFP